MCDGTGELIVLYALPGPAGSLVFTDQRVIDGAGCTASLEPTSSGSANVECVESASFRVSRVAFGAGDRPLHYHERACLSVMLGGVLTEHIGGRAIECTRAGVLLKPPGEPHRDEFSGSVQVIVEPSDDAALSLGESQSLFQSIAYRRSLIATAIAGRIAREVQGFDPFTHLAVEGLTLELLACILRAGRGPLPPVRAPIWLARVRDRLDDGVTLPALADLAADVQVHPAYLARTFRRCYGLSIGQYARTVRLDWVTQQLVETTEPLSAIAFRAGFADQSHLTRMFRARWGVTPRQYRLAARKRT